MDLGNLAAIIRAAVEVYRLVRDEWGRKRKKDDEVKQTKPARDPPGRASFVLRKRRA